MANDFRSARVWAREIIQNALSEGMSAVDATMGNGHDTQWLCEQVGETGRVYAFDVQREAVARTEERLQSAGLLKRATLFLAGHERMRELVPQPVDAILFNLGWLPGAEHGITTRTDTTIQAVNAALELLKEDAVMTICVYPGHAEGARERAALMDWATALDPARFDAALKTYLNQPNDPPCLIAVRKVKRKRGWTEQEQTNF